ncbi:hypothetical protein LVJ94_01200 [Pendulispora rubella]|uniref:Carbohydrate-binding protein n=1 Tax=Pendulispora rubella TaxID=2741070 RepID=A0ABZ2L8J4_9BACT
MEGTREESVSTSLKELLRLEEERQCREEEEIARRAEIARVEREARERAALEADQDKKKRAAEEREAAAARQREAEDARQREGEAAAEERQRAHERELARLRAGNATPSSSPSPRSGLAIGLLAGTALTVALASAGYVGFLQPQIARANDATLRILKERSTLREQVTQVERALTEERAKFAALQAELTAARQHGERLERDLEAERRGRPWTPAATPAAVVRPKETAPSPPTLPQRPCAQGDPLCP